MPRGFSDQEKEYIRSRLVETGKSQFERFGLKKTNIEEITKAVGISKGAFYIFFDSKEALFMEVLETIEIQFRETLFTDIFPEDVPPKTAFKDFLLRALNELDAEPLLKQVGKEEYEMLIRKLPPERVLEHTDNDLRYFSEFYKQYQNTGIFKQEDPNAFGNLLKGLYLLNIHKEDFDDEQSHHQMMALLVEMITNHFVKD
jgi:AcrR family transcriptional regulator